MSFSRRKFLRSGALVAAAASIPITKAMATGSGSWGLASEKKAALGSQLSLNREAFTKCLNSRFSFSHQNSPSASLKLIEVRDLTPPAGKRSAAATGKECFSAVFIGSADDSLHQETYTVSHSSLGTFEMFLVPNNKTGQRRYYEALFNRLY